MPEILSRRLLKNNRITLEIWLESRGLNWEKLFFIYAFKGEIIRKNSFDILLRVVRIHIRSDEK